MIQLMRRALPDCGHHWATVCSSWIWICRATTRRSQSVPLGLEPRCEAVHKGNLMVSIMAALMLWAIADGQTFILEQPSSSLMTLVPRMVQVQRTLEGKWQMVKTCMGAYGADSQKDTHLYSGSSYVQKLQRTLSPEDKCRLEESDVILAHKCPITGDINGGADLKASQAYPRGYGKKVAEVFLGHHDRRSVDDDDDRTVDAYEVPLPMPTSDQWIDVPLFAQLCAQLGVPSDRMIA